MISLGLPLPPSSVIHNPGTGPCFASAIAAGAIAVGAADGVGNSVIWGFWTVAPGGIRPT